MVSDLDEQEVIMVGCGDEHTVCITIANEVYGFGHGVYDQLGLGTLGIFPNPQRIPGISRALQQNLNHRIFSYVCITNSVRNTKTEGSIVWVVIYTEICIRNSGGIVINGCLDT